MYRYCKYIQLFAEFKDGVVSGDSIHEMGDLMPGAGGHIRRRRKNPRMQPVSFIHRRLRLPICHAADLQTTIAATVASRLHKRGGLAAPCIVDQAIRIRGCKHDAPGV